MLPVIASRMWTALTARAKPGLSPNVREVSAPVEYLFIVRIAVLEWLRVVLQGFPRVEFMAMSWRGDGFPGMQLGLTIRRPERFVLAVNTLSCWSLCSGSSDYERYCHP